jgi:TetR/AcrR family transcriptional regulator, transcriptional repressor for nem operon
MGKAEETRKSIIEKSAVIFNKNGYQRTSMSTLTEALGLTKGAIYGHFTDKDELAVEAFRSSVEKIRLRIGDRIGYHEGALGKLRAYAESFAVLFEETRNTGGCPILNTATDSDDTHPQLLDEVRRALITWEEGIVRLVELGMSTGEFRPSADAYTFAANFIALIEGGILLAKTLNDQKYLERSVGAIDLLIDAMLAALPLK